MKNLLDLFKKKKKEVHVLQIYENPIIFPINEQIKWILNNCPNNQFKDAKDFNKFAYEFTADIIKFIISAIDYNKDTISISIRKDYEFNIWTHENGCVSFSFYSHTPIDSNISQLKKFINNINLNYICLNLPEYINQSK